MGEVLNLKCWQELGSLQLILPSDQLQGAHETFVGLLSLTGQQLQTTVVVRSDVLCQVYAIILPSRDLVQDALLPRAPETVLFVLGKFHYRIEYKGTPFGINLIIGYSFVYIFYDSSHTREVSVPQGAGNPG